MELLAREGDLAFKGIHFKGEQQMKSSAMILQLTVFYALTTISVSQCARSGAKFEIAIFFVVIVNVVGTLMLIRYGRTEGRNRWVVFPSYHLPTTIQLEIERQKQQSTVGQVETPSRAYYALHMIEVLQLTEILDKSEVETVLRAEPYEFSEQDFEQAWRLVCSTLVRGGHQLQIFGGRYIQRNPNKRTVNRKSRLIFSGTANA